MRIPRIADESKRQTQEKPKKCSPRRRRPRRAGATDKNEP